MNAISLDGVFTPLTVTDRLLADQPAFGVALAHVWPSATPDRRASSKRPVQPSQRSESRTARATPSSGSARAVGRTWSRSPHGSAAAMMPSSAARRSASTSTTSPSRSPSASRRRQVAQSHRRCRSVGGACVVFLVAPEGVLRATEGIAEAAAVEGVEWVRAYRRPGWRFEPLRRGADRAGAILATGRRPRRRPGPGSPCGAGRTLPGRCEPGVAPSSASSLPRSARRRSPPSPRRSAPAG